MMEEEDSAVVPSWSAEERDRFLKSLLEDDDGKEMPLLAESVDEMDPDLVAALVQLRDGDDSPLELATAAKERGNKHFATGLKTKKRMWYKEAAKEYTDGLSLCRAAAAEGERERQDDAEALGRLSSVLRSNRAACALALANYGDAKRDCRDALAADPGNVKALYRLGKACVELKQWEQAKQTCEWAFSLNSSLPPEFRQIAKVAKERLEEAKRQRQLYAEFFENFTRMNVQIAPRNKNSSDDGPKSPEEWPLVIEYPEMNVPFDYVETVHVDLHLYELLLRLFPEEQCPPWDSLGLYHAANLTAYVRQPRRRLRTVFQSAEEYAEYRTSGARTAAGDDDDGDDEDDVTYLEISPAATFRQVVTHRQFAMTGPLKLQLRPLGTAEHEAWRRRASILSIGPPVTGA